MPSPLDESMQRALAKVLAERPDIKPVTATPSSGSLIESMFLPKSALAITNPFTGNIRYNTAALQGQSQQDLEQTMAHELTHSKQAQDTPWWKTAVQSFLPQGDYAQRPYEAEAFQAERDRANKMDLRNVTDPVTGAMDIPLPKDRKKTGVGPSPNFQMGK